VSIPTPTPTPEPTPVPAPGPAPAPANGLGDAVSRFLDLLPLSGAKTYLGGAVFLALAGWCAYRGEFPDAARYLGLALTAVGLRHAVARAIPGG
jgi:hypothetical protein